jgi:hypothetical protein
MNQGDITMNTTKLTSLAAIAVLGLSGAAFAAGDGEKVTFETLDKNGDGFVERTDVPADHDLSTMFASYDLDQDNRLSATEFDSYSGASEVEEAEE